MYQVYIGARFTFVTDAHEGDQTVTVTSMQVFADCDGELDTAVTFDVVFSGGSRVGIVNDIPTLARNLHRVNAEQDWGGNDD